MDWIKGIIVLLAIGIVFLLFLKSVSENEGFYL